MLIPTVEGDVDDSLLVKTEGGVDNDHERTTWVEYRRPGSDVVIHRSAHVTLKRGLEGAGQQTHFDVDAWARNLVDDLIAQRRETGQPAELRGVFTSEEQDALRRALDSSGVAGSLTTE